MTREQLNQFLATPPTDADFTLVNEIKSKRPEDMTASELAVFMKFFGLADEIGREPAKALIEARFPER